MERVAEMGAKSLFKQKPHPLIKITLVLGCYLQTCNFVVIFMLMNNVYV